MTYRLTLAEAESYLRKVARACGMEWGIAEEAGKAARWLAAFALPGPEMMLRHMRGLRGRDYTEFAPDCGLEPWQASGGILCPVITGAALADRSAQMLDGRPVELGRIAYPLLLAPALGQAARLHDSVFSASWPGVRIDCYAFGLTIEGRPEDLEAGETSNVGCYRGIPSKPALQASTTAYSIDYDVFTEIDALAFETYVPASEESRAGAGAGLTDND